MQTLELFSIGVKWVTFVARDARRVDRRKMCTTSTSALTVTLPNLLPLWQTVRACI